MLSCFELRPRWVPLICEFLLYEKLIEMRGDYVLICKLISHLSPFHINT